MKTKSSWEKRFNRACGTPSDWCGCWDGDVAGYFPSQKRKLKKFISKEIQKAVEEEHRKSYQEGALKQAEMDAKTIEEAVEEEKGKLREEIENMKVMSLQEAEELGYGGYENQYERTKDVYNQAIDDILKILKPKQSI